MTVTRLLFAASCLFAAGASPAAAQSFLMNSAETINPGNFKLAAFPTVFTGDDEGGSEWGLATRLGYGFTPRFDVEAKVAFFDGLTMYGADAEYWLRRGSTDVSLSAGFHLSDLEGDLGDSKALDLAAIVSRGVGDRLELYVGGSLSFESFDDEVEDGSFERFYLVPGAEYKLGEDIDLLAEIGIGLTDESSTYLSFGAAYYIR
jgi:hypothetical protein